MSYSVEGFEPPTTFNEGTSLLISGNTLSTDERLLDVATPSADERVILITTKMGAEQVVSELEARGASKHQIGIIDCTGQEAVLDEVLVRKLSSPGDLTGISLEFAKLLKEFEDAESVRIGFNSISTVLMYSELRTMFRFLHVFTARIRSGKMFGAFAMDPSMHEQQAYNTIRAVFDCEAQVDENDQSLLGNGFTQA